MSYFRSANDLYSYWFCASLTSVSNPDRIKLLATPIAPATVVSRALQCDFGKQRTRESACEGTRWSSIAMQ